MRIISQGGKCDYPYESSTLFIDYMDGCVIKIVPSTGGCKGTKIATYSTEEKAIKAMEMLRERHTDNVFCREDIQYRAEIMLDDGLDIVREMMMKCEYFQFPKDDEVKV
uniref:Small RNA degrading nuclease 1 Recognition Motif, RNA BINDING n=1 Tax=virus sp. ctQmo6 TaxID=2827990 RepID=A0A8S5RG46_9VIRU|nr:MAG TPA: Small RNA degrading nuclease 1 Recognition Motif, RNA BINDING [virus sp. ctQmo6]